MSFRRLVLPILSLLVAACSDTRVPSAPAPGAPVLPAASGPHFLRWAPNTAPQFEALGAVAQGAAFLGGGTLASLVGDSAPAVDAYAASFWAVRGESRSLAINYVSGESRSPFLVFTATDPTWAPGVGALALGDSVLITVRVDSLSVAGHFEPSGLQFGAPAALTIWYGGVDGDLNDDGAVDEADAAIETQLLGIWYQATEGSPWTPMAAIRDLTAKSFTASISHFSGYAVSW